MVQLATDYRATTLSFSERYVQGAAGGWGLGAQGSLRTGLERGSGPEPGPGPGRGPRSGPAQLEGPWGPDLQVGLVPQPPVVDLGQG